MRKLKFFFIKYKPIFYFVFALVFIAEQGYVIQLRNQKEPDEYPKCKHLNYSIDFVTKDKYKLKVISTINYNSNGWFWSVFSSEKRIKTEFTKLLEQQANDSDLYDLIQNLNDIQLRVFTKSLYSIEEQCNIDIYDYQISLSITKQVFDQYIERRQADQQFKNLMRTKRLSGR